MAKKMRRKKKPSIKPDYRLKLKARDPDDPSSAIIGSAWIKTGGRISVSLHPGCAVTGDMCGRDGKWMLTLWPIKGEE